mmetsp:Transcript_15021/g.29982  ORF Transcript_15021/g.29982 Transcript_15021/m.29982 type:complete len:108 (-) Transcript_15021:91-414(-)
MNATRVFYVNSAEELCQMAETLQGHRVQDRASLQDNVVEEASTTLQTVPPQRLLPPAHLCSRRRGHAPSSLSRAPRPHVLFLSSLHVSRKGSFLLWKEVRCSWEGKK